MRSAVPPGCLSLVLLTGLLVLLPVFLADVMLTALAKLGLSPAASLLAAFGIFLGGAGTFDGRIVLSGLVATVLA